MTQLHPEALTRGTKTTQHNPEALERGSTTTQHNPGALKRGSTTTQNQPEALARGPTTTQHKSEALKRGSTRTQHNSEALTSGPTPRHLTDLAHKKVPWLDLQATAGDIQADLDQAESLAPAGESTKTEKITDWRNRERIE
jgi:hypothetical protein